MNKMTVSTWLLVSPEGPVTCAQQDGKEKVHLRQGGLDGACGPYSVVMALITLGILRYAEATSMYQWSGRSREGRFRDELKKFGALVSEGTDGRALVGLVDMFKTQRVGAEYLTGTKRDIVDAVKQTVDQCNVPIIGVAWAGGSGHWMMVVGYQGYEEDGQFQLTHLLCLDPASETPKTSLWNAVIAVYEDDGASVGSGPLPSVYWGHDGVAGKCRIDDAVLVFLV